jgi:CBS domain-containing protein
MRVTLAVACLVSLIAHVAASQAPRQLSGAVRSTGTGTYPVERWVAPAMSRVAPGLAGAWRTPCDGTARLPERPAVAAVAFSWGAWADPELPEADPMTETARDVMTPVPITVSADTSVDEAARLMRDRDIGDVLVARGDVLMGIATDRDLVVRVLAEGLDPRATPIEQACSGDLVVVRADDTVSDVIRLLRDRAIRRVPVMDDGQAVGIISLGDLARQLDPQSVLAEISAAPAND